MTRIRSTFSKKSKYYISQHAFLTVYHHCLNYADWKAEYDASIGLQHGNSDGGSRIGNPTASQAIRLMDLSKRIDLIRNTAHDVEPDLDPWLLMYVTDESMTFDKLKALGMPCERDMFYDRRRKFYWIMAKKMGY